MTRSVNTDSDTIHRDRKYPQAHDFKPRGLWYAIDNQWVEWCTDNMDGWIKKNIILLDINTSRLLIIENILQLEEFIAKFSIAIIPDSKIKYIDWLKVSHQYSGIEIQNYHQLKWSKEIDIGSVWFSTFDISGGCIWDLSIIKSFTCRPLAVEK